MLQHYFGPIVLLLFSYCVARSFVKDTRNHPKSIHVAGPSGVFGRWLTALKATFQYSEIARQAYDKTGGGAFAIPTLKCYHVFIGDKKKIGEIINAPDSQLSFNEFQDEVLHREYLGVYHDPHDQHNKLAVQVLRNQLRNSVPQLSSEFRDRVEGVTRKIVAENHTDSEGWTSVPLASMVREIAGHLNVLVMLGQELSRDPEIPRLVNQFLDDIKATIVTLDFSPRFMHNTLAQFTMGRTGARKELGERLGRMIQGRMDREQALAEKDEPIEKPMDCLQWILDASREHNVKGIDKSTRISLGLLLAAGFQAPMFVIYALYALCQHPQYIPALRQELSTLADPTLVDSTKSSAAPQLDSFLKETARLYPIQVGNVNRKVMAPFVFADGTSIPADTILGVPQEAIMADKGHYPDADVFDGLRFMPGKTEGNPDGGASSSFSQPSPNFLFWGPVGRSCPGRFYVNGIAKMILANTIMKYDFKLADASLAASWRWGAVVVPNPRLKIVLREREKAGV